MKNYKLVRVSKDKIVNDTYPLEFGGEHRGVRHVEISKEIRLPARNARIGAKLEDGWEVREIL